MPFQCRVQVYDCEPLSLGYTLYGRYDFTGYHTVVSSDRVAVCDSRGTQKDPGPCRQAAKLEHEIGQIGFKLRPVVGPVDRPGIVGPELDNHDVGEKGFRVGKLFGVPIGLIPVFQG